VPGCLSQNQASLLAEFITALDTGSRTAKQTAPDFILKKKVQLWF